jgi:hypothetical protein
VVPQVNPVIAPPGSAIADVPEPRLWGVVAFPYDVVVPYSNDAVVDALFGFTVPFNVAPVRLMPVGAPAATVGAQAVVMNVALAPFVVPPTFVATTRK